LKRHPHVSELYAALAAAYERDAKADEAMNIYQQVVETSASTSPPVWGVCGVLRRCFVEALKSARPAAVAVGAVWKKSSAEVSNPDIVRFRRMLQNLCDSAEPRWAFEAYLARLLFERLAAHTDAVSSAADDLLSNLSSGGVVEQRQLRVHQAAALVVLVASEADLQDVRANAVLRSVLHKALSAFPDDPWLLGVYAAASCRLLRDESSRFLYRLTASSEDRIGAFVMGAFIWQRRGESNRALGLLDRCVRRVGSRSVWAWRMLLRTCTREERRRREFLRGVSRCAWSRAFWLDALEKQSPILSRAEALDIASIISEKGVYMRRPLVNELQRGEQNGIVQD